MANQSNDELMRAPAAEQASSPASAAEKPADASNQTNSPETEEKQGSLLNDVMDIIEAIVTSVFLVMVVFTFLFCVASVEGTSMVPTLKNGDRLIVSRAFNQYERGDILILDSETAYVFDAEGNLTENEGLGKRIVKRLIATGGQEVNIDFAAKTVSVDDTVLDEPYISALTDRDEGAFSYPITVPEGYVFVLGDNRPVSRDSRDPNVGLIPVTDIIGEVRLRIAPFSEFGTVE